MVEARAAGRSKLAPPCALSHPLLPLDSGDTRPEPTTIYICVDDFGIKYASQKQRHTPTDGQSYKYTVDWTEALSWTHYQSGITFKWVRISMPYYRQGINPIQHKHPTP
jgi:hypothetical protein